MIFCAVSGCDSDSISLSNYAFQFHPVPKSKVLLAKWVLLLGRLPKDSYVCSRHFDDTMFTDSNKKTLINYAMPKPFWDSASNDSPVEMESSELFACRACLAADGRLYAISGSGLEDTLAALTGISCPMFPMEDSLPRHLCVFCMAKLSKCAVFRDSCQQSTKLLKSLLNKGPLNMKVIEAYSRKSQQLTNKLTRNKLFQFDSGSFIDLMPLIKTEDNENSHEEPKSAEVYIDGDNFVNNDVSDVENPLELPTDNREGPGSKVVEGTKNIECIKIEEEIENHDVNSEIHYCLESEVENDTNDIADASEETSASKKPKKTIVTLIDNNEVNHPKKHGNFLLLLSKVVKNPTDINTKPSTDINTKSSTDINIKTPKATTVARKSVGTKSAGTKTIFKKKNRRKKKLLCTDVKKPHLWEIKQNIRRMHTCDLCGKEYKRIGTLRAHRSTHDPNMTKEEIAILKKETDFEFEKQYNFDIKLLSKEEQKQRIEERKNNLSTYSCDVCGIEHHTESTLDAHKTTYHNSSLPMECDVCFYRFQSQQKLRHHQLLDRHRYVFTCKECGYATGRRVLAKEHYFVHQGKKFTCQYCGRTYGHQVSLYGHLRKKHPTENEACDECGHICMGQIGLLVHKRVMHKKEIFKCSVCDVTFSSAEALQRHTELTEGLSHAALFPCAVCGESCGSETALAAHAAEKHPPKWSFCEECNETFSSASAFATHVNRKHMNRPAAAGNIVCEVCGKRFLSMPSLQYHMNGHLGLRPYQCAHCPKAFTDKTKLRVHMRVHTGEKPYKCKQCPMAFSNKANFQRHMKNVHLRMQAKCDLCGKTMSAASLQAHINAVHRKLPYYRRKRTRTKKPARDTESSVKLHDK